MAIRIRRFLVKKGSENFQGDSFQSEKKTKSEIINTDS